MISRHGPMGSEAHFAFGSGHITYTVCFCVGTELKLFNWEIPVEYMSRERFIGVIATTN